jgi:hypothetical protein
MSRNKNTTQKEKKQLVIKEVDKALQKYWNKTYNSSNGAVACQ